MDDLPVDGDDPDPLDEGALGPDPHDFRDALARSPLVGDDAALRANLEEEGRVLLAITPDEPPEAWRSSGLD